MRLILLSFLCLAWAFSTNCAIAQTRSFLIHNPAGVENNQNAYYAAPRELARRVEKVEAKRAPASRISAVMPPVDLMTREHAASYQSGNPTVQLAPTSVVANGQSLPTFASEFEPNARSANPAVTEFVQPNHVWPAQASPYPVNAAMQPASPPLQTQAQSFVPPGSMSINDQYYAPSTPVAATQSPAFNGGQNQRADLQSKSTGQTSNCCDEWKDFFPCNRVNFDWPCTGPLSPPAGTCNCHAHCPGSRKRNCRHNRSDVSCGAQPNACCSDDSKNTQCNSAQSNGSRNDESKPRRFSFLTININR